MEGGGFIIESYLFAEVIKNRKAELLTFKAFMEYNYLNDTLLNQIKKVILKTETPSKIILFGSRARGEINDSSDYDILIIKKSLGNEREFTRRLNKALYKNRIIAPVDLIAIDEKKWETDKNDIGMIYSNIYSEGVSIYG